MINKILFTKKFIFAPSILNSHLEFENPFQACLWLFLSWHTRVEIWCNQKYSRLRWLLRRVKSLAICFHLGWSGSILQFRQNIIKVGSKSWLLTCSSNTLAVILFGPGGLFMNKMPLFQRVGMREGGLPLREPLPPAFIYFILMAWRAWDLNLVMISSVATKCQDLKVFNFIL